MRFSVLLYLSAPLLCLIDKYTHQKCISNHRAWLTLTEKKNNKEDRGNDAVNYGETHSFWKEEATGNTSRYHEAKNWRLPWSIAKWCDCMASRRMKNKGKGWRCRKQYRLSFNESCELYCFTLSLVKCNVIELWYRKVETESEPLVRLFRW